MSSEILLWAVVAVLLVLATFLAMSETAITRMNRVKAMTLAEEKRRGAETLLKIVEHPEQFLNPVLLLVLGSHLVMASLVGVLVERGFGAAGVAIAIAFEVIVISCWPRRYRRRMRCSTRSAPP